MDRFQGRFPHSEEETVRRINEMELPSKEELAAIAAMTPEERWARAIELNKAHRQSVLREVEAEHPDWSQEHVRNLWRRRLLMEAFKDEPLPPGLDLNAIYPLP